MTHTFCRESESAKVGYPSLYYPGVPIWLQRHRFSLPRGSGRKRIYSMSPGPVYHLTGSVSGYPPQQGVGLHSA